MLGPATDDDIGELARLHRLAFPDFFLSSLGDRFLAQFYVGFLRDPSAVTVVAKAADGRIVGAVVGTTEPEHFFRNLLRRQWLGFAIASARTMVVQPSVAPRLVRAVRYRGPRGSASAALLSSVCVHPSLQGRGIGSILLREWTLSAARCGAMAARLATDAEQNDAVNAFYQDHGWNLTGFYHTREGRTMNEYSISFTDECPK